MRILETFIDPHHHHDIVLSNNLCKYSFGNPQWEAVSKSVNILTSFVILGAYYAEEIGNYWLTVNDQPLESSTSSMYYESHMVILPIGKLE